MVGRVFMGRYEVLRLLGEGGMGRVYLARQLDLGRQVVVKVMHEHIAADPKFCERFTRETLLMARFQHPYAVTLYDASLNDPQGPCIVMEYIRGVTLDTLLHRNGRLSPGRVGRLLGQLCEVLQAAHAAGIIHRDLKPANLMVVDPDTPYELLKVMDFGLAKLLGPQASNPQMIVTNNEFAVGTPGYMCPEQARGEEMDHRGDLYSVGAILFELLAGRLPFAGASTMDVLLARATQEPPTFAEVGATGLVPPAVEAVVHWCLAKYPVDRPACARDLAERYEQALFESEIVDSTLLHTPHLPGNTAVLNGVRPAATLALAPAAAPAPAPAPALLAPEPVPPPERNDPWTIIHSLEAWMPEKIAAYKLRGFVQDVGGELVENAPGRILVRLGGRNCVYSAPRCASFSWFGLAPRTSLINMELRLNRPDPGRDNLKITVVLSPQAKSLADDEEWRARCGQIFCDLRAYLMGHSGPH